MSFATLKLLLRNWIDIEFNELMASVELLYSGNWICFIIEEFGNINHVVLLSITVKLQYKLYCIKRNRNRKDLNFKEHGSVSKARIFGDHIFYDRHTLFYSEEPIINYFLTTAIITTVKSVVYTVQCQKTSQSFCKFCLFLWQWWIKPTTTILLQ